MLSSNPDPGKRDHPLQKNTSLFNAPLKKPQLSILLHFVIFLSRHHNWELFKYYIWEIFSAGHNCLMSRFSIWLLCNVKMHKINTVFLLHICSIFFVHTTNVLFLQKQCDTFLVGFILILYRWSSQIYEYEYRWLHKPSIIFLYTLILS